MPIISWHGVSVALNADLIGSHFASGALQFHYLWTKSRGINVSPRRALTRIQRVSDCTNSLSDANVHWFRNRDCKIRFNWPWVSDECLKHWTLVRDSVKCRALLMLGSFPGMELHDLFIGVAALFCSVLGKELISRPERHQKINSF